MGPEGRPSNIHFLPAGDIPGLAGEPAHTRRQKMFNDYKGRHFRQTRTAGGAESGATYGRL